MPKGAVTLHKEFDRPLGCSLVLSRSEKEQATNPTLQQSHIMARKAAVPHATMLNRQQAIPQPLRGSSLYTREPDRGYANAIPHSSFRILTRPLSRLRRQLSQRESQGRRVHRSDAKRSASVPIRSVNRFAAIRCDAEHAASVPPTQFRIPHSEFRIKKRGAFAPLFCLTGSGSAWSAQRARR